MLLSLSLQRGIDGSGVLLGMHAQAYLLLAQAHLLLAQTPLLISPTCLLD
ncbi:hypothetical protein MY11210_001331 [Beauveria gryllotalpidicola]